MQVAVLGPLEVSTADGVVEIAGARLRTLLIRLALAAPASVSATALADALWGDEQPADPANALQSLVSRLRRALHNPQLIQPVTGGYQLMIGADDLDLRRFTRLARAGHDSLRSGQFREAASQLRDALALWRGDALDESIERDPALLVNLQEQRLDALADRIEADLALGRGGELVAELDQLVVANPLRERLTLLLIRALHAAGRVPEALAAYEQSRRTLAHELGLDPSPAMQAAQLALLRGESSADIDEPAGADNADNADNADDPSQARNNLRAQLTSFVGRDEDVRRIGKLLDEGRLVTLVGPGGAGKTRLAIESVGRLGEQLVDGVWLAELAPVSNPGDVPQVVLAALGLRDSTLIDRPGPIGPGDATSRLVDALIERQCVIILDNCEHLIESAAALADELLARCRGLRILATSREPLGVYGEVLVGVAPLGQPAPGATPADALAFPATQLFLDRAVAVRPYFVVDEITVESVVEIVRRLDGLPLAIELAAARLRTMPVEQVAARLTDRFRLLTGGSRTAVPRHRTLLAVVEWSWDLLSEDERRLARRLAVFVGGITVSSATDVCASSELPEQVVEDLLASLVDKSFLQLVPDRGRYRMLETLREFGLERMAAAQEVATIRATHAQHFAALAARADPQLRTRDQLIWLDVLNYERDNIVAALRFLADDGQHEAAVNVAIAMNWYWVLIGRHADAVNWTGYALAAAGEVDPIHRLIGEALVAINSAAAIWSQPSEQMQHRIEAMSELNARLDDVDVHDIHPLVRVLRPILAMFTDDRDRAERLVEEAIVSGDPWTVATARTFRAAIAENDGNAERARSETQASLAEFRELGERWGMGNCLQLLGAANMMSGDLAQAAQNFEEALERFGELGASEDEAMIRLRLADVLFRQGNVAEARRQIEVAVSRSQARERETMFGTHNESVLANVMIADIERQSGNLDHARRWRDEALERIEGIPVPHPAQGHLFAISFAIAAKIDLADGDTATAAQRLAAAYGVAVATKDMPIVSNVGVGIAMLAVALDRASDAAVILGAAAQLRGGDDATAPDIHRLQTELEARLGAQAFAEQYESGRAHSRDKAIARLDPVLLTS